MEQDQGFCDIRGGMDALRSLLPKVQQAGGKISEELADDINFLGRDIFLCARGARREEVQEASALLREFAEAFSAATEDWVANHLRQNMLGRVGKMRTIFKKDSLVAERFEE